MGKPQRRFGKEFKAEAVRLVEVSGRKGRSPRTSASAFQCCGAGSTSASYCRDQGSVAGAQQ
jgi:transposase-like protein